MNAISCANAVKAAARVFVVWSKRILLAAAIIGPLGAAGLRAADKKPEIPCADTALGFDAATYVVKCTDLSNSALDVGAGDAFGAAKTTKLDADSDAEQTFLIAIDNRPIGQLFIKRRSLQNDVEGYFSGGAFKDWTAGTAVAQFEVEEFSGETDSGSLMDCIGFRHQGAKRYDGIARLVIGVACSTRGRARAYEALKHLQAPSG